MYTCKGIDKMRHVEMPQGDLVGGEAGNGKENEPLAGHSPFAYAFFGNQFLNIRMARLVRNELMESHVEMARMLLSFTVDCPVLTLLGST